MSDSQELSDEIVEQYRRVLIASNLLFNQAKVIERLHMVPVRDTLVHAINLLGSICYVVGLGHLDIPSLYVRKTDLHKLKNDVDTVSVMSEPAAHLSIQKLKEFQSELDSSVGDDDTLTDNDMFEL